MRRRRIRSLRRRLDFDLSLLRALRHILFRSPGKIVDVAIEISKTLNSNLYPDIAEKGGLVTALQRVFDEMGANLVVTDPEFLVSAHVRTGDRSSLVETADRERAFCVDFWHQGVIYGNGSVDELAEVGRAIAFFHHNLSSIQEMASRFAWFGTETRALAHEKGASYFVEDAWQRLESRLNADRVDPSTLRLLSLVREAARRPELRQLLPFRSLYRLCFSRTTGYPYTRDCPLIHAIGDECFRVVASDGGKVLGEGHLVQAVDILVANLPQNCGPAIHGTAENFRE
jgi:hypothetical protein